MLGQLLDGRYLVEVELGALAKLILLGCYNASYLKVAPPAARQ
jgi:hypothetical protein